MATPAAVLSILIRTTGLGKASKDVDNVQRQLERTNASIGSNEKSWQRLSTTAGGVTQSFTSVGRQADSTSRILRKLGADTESTATSADKIEKRFGRFDRSLGDFNRVAMAARNALMLLKFPALIAGAGLAAQAIGALTAAAGALVSALAPLAGAYAGIAVGYTALAQATGVVKLAFKDVSKALGGNKKALEALTPSQRAFVQQLKESQGEVKKLREAAAANMFGGLTQALRNVQPLWQPLRQVVAATAKELGNLAVAGSRSVRSWGPDLATIGKTNVGIIHNLGSAAIVLAGAFKNVIVTAGPLATWMSQLAERGAKYVASAVEAGRRSGELAAFFQKTRAVMSQMGRILGNLAVGLWNISKAAAPLGRDLLSSFEKLTKRFRDWTGSVQGKNRIAQFFADAREPARQLFGLVGDLAGALGRLMVPNAGTAKMIGGLRQLVPVLESVISTTTTALGPALASLATNLVKIVAIFAGTSGPLTLTVKALNALATVVSTLLTNVPGLAVFASTMIGLGASFKLIQFLLKPFAAGVGGIAKLWGLVTGGARSAAAMQTEAGVSAVAGAERGALAVSGLAGAWRRVAVSAGEASAAQALASKTSAGGKAGQQLGLFASSVGTKAAAKQPQLQLFPTPAQIQAQAAATVPVVEKVATSRFSGLMGKLSAVGTKMMGAAGIAMGGVLTSQIAGQLVGGGAGKWISALGTGGSLGAALGSVIGQPAAGAIIGTVAAGILKWTQGPDPAAEGRAWAANFTSQLPGTVIPKVRAALAQASAQGTKTMATANAGQTPEGTYGPGYQTWMPNAAQVQQQYKESWNKTFNEIFNAAYKWGGAAGQSFGTQMQTLSRPTELIVSANMQRILSQVPKQIVAQGPTMVQAWRQSAVQQMVAYATQMEQSGRLPRGSVSRMIQSIEQLFPGLKQFIVNSGMQTAAGLASTYRFSQAQKNLVTAVQGFRNTYGDMAMDAKITNGNMLKNVRVAMIDLQGLMRTGPMKGRQAAAAQYAQLKQQVSSYFQGYLAVTQAKFAGIAAVMGSKSREGRAAGQKAFSSFYGDIYKAMADGVITTGQGASLIAKELQSALKAFGSGFHVPAPAILFLTQAGKQGVSTGASGRHLDARGGLHQVGRAGAAGRDTVPINAGGVPIMAGSGEQIAVFNRHQQKVVNAALSPMGGLPGLFHKVDRPNYMASGGLVPGFSVGGNVSGLHGDFLNELNQLSKATGVNITVSSGYRSAAEQAVLFARHPDPKWVAPPGQSKHQTGEAADISPARPAYHGMEGKYGLYFPMSWEPWHIQNVTLKGGKGLGAVPATVEEIKAPKVKGGGTMGAGIQAGLNKLAGEATKRLSKEAAKAAPVYGGGGGMTALPNAGNWQGTLQAIAKQKNWSASDWMWIVQHESSGNPNARNPSSGAYGLGQFLPSNFGAYPGAGSSDPVAQIQAMARYIQERYKTPTGAKAFWQANNWYSRGGMIPEFASGGAFRVMASQETDTKPGKGAFSSKGIYPHGLMYSILGKTGTSRDGDAGAGYAFVHRVQPPFPLFIKAVGGNNIARATLGDIGSGSDALIPHPSIGLYSKTSAIVGGANKLVDIQRADSKQFETLRGVPIPQFANVKGQLQSSAPSQKGATKTPMPSWSTGANLAKGDLERLNLKPIKFPASKTLKKARKLASSPWASNTDALNKQVAAIDGLIGDRGFIATVADTRDSYDAMFQATHPNLQYTYTDPGGKTYADDASIQASYDELTKLKAWQQQIVDAYNQAKNAIASLTAAIQKEIARLEKEIKKRQDEVKEIQAQIRRNIALLPWLDWEAAGRPATTWPGAVPGDLKRGPWKGVAGDPEIWKGIIRDKPAKAALGMLFAATGWGTMKGGDKPATTPKAKQQAQATLKAVGSTGTVKGTSGAAPKVDWTEAAKWMKRAEAVRAENTEFGGFPNKVGSAGLIGTLNKQIGAVDKPGSIRAVIGGGGDSGVGTLRGIFNDEVTNKIRLVGLSGIGGETEAAAIKMIELNGQIKPLQDWIGSHGGDIAKSINDANQSLVPSQSDAEIRRLQQALELATNRAVYYAQAATLAQPLVGAFAGGGEVPQTGYALVGERGPELVELPRGTQVNSAGVTNNVMQGGDVTHEVHLHFAPGTEWLRDFVDVRVDRKTRRAAGNRAPLPGARR